VPRKEIDKVFKYMYSTAPQPPSPNEIETAPLVSVTVASLMCDMNSSL